MQHAAVGAKCMDAHTTGNESAAFGSGALGAHTTGISQHCSRVFIRSNSYQLVETIHLLVVHQVQPTPQELEGLR